MSTLKPSTMMFPSYALLSDIPLSAVTTTLSAFTWHANGSRVFVRDEFHRTFFEKAFNTKILAAYNDSRTVSAPKKKERTTDLVASACSIILFFPDGRFTVLHISEWLGLSTSN